MAVQDRSAAGLLEQARHAVGSPASLAAVKSLMLKGEAQRRNQMSRPDNLSVAPAYVQVPFEIRVLLPDYYHATWARGRGSPMVLAFHGEKSLNGNRVDLERQNFVRLALALFLRLDTAIPLKLDERVLGAATLKVTGAGGFAAFLDLDPKSHLPLRLRHTIVMKNGPDAGKARELTWVLEDRRMIQGLSVPHRIVMSHADVHDETHRFQSISINPPLTPSDFIVGTGRSGPGGK
ncbi:MAG: hypothetical protein WD227_05095 [Vicinamibacterales bacterium]